MAYRSVHHAPSSLLAHLPAHNPPRLRFFLCHLPHALSHPQGRSARHAAAAKRLAPEYLTGSEIGPAIKRTRIGALGGSRPGMAMGMGSCDDGPYDPSTRPGGAHAGAQLLPPPPAPPGCGPQVRGWRLLGNEAGPAADQVCPFRRSGCTCNIYLSLTFRGAASETIRWCV